MAKFLAAKDQIYLSTLTDIDQSSCHTGGFVEFTVFDIGIISAFYLYLLITIIVSKCKFSHTALANAPDYPRSLKFKLSLLIILIITFIICGALSIFYEDYWTNTCGLPALGLIYLIPIIALVFQYSWLRYQFERKIPLLWFQNQLFWTLVSFCYLFTVISCYAISDNKGTGNARLSKPDFILLVIKTTLSTLMMIYTIRKPQDLAEYLSESGLRSGLRSGLIQRIVEPQRVVVNQPKEKFGKDSGIKKKTKTSTAKSSGADDKADFPLSVTVANKVQIKEDSENGIKETSYKLQVKLGSNEYSKRKTLKDFKRLENSLIGEMGDSPTHSFGMESLNAVFSDIEIETSSNVSFKVQALQNFLNSALLNPDGISNSLLLFLEVPESERVKLLNWGKRSFKKNEERITMVEMPRTDARGIQANPSSSSAASELDEVEEEEEEKTENHEQPEIVINADRDGALSLGRISEKDYCPYFKVNILKYQRAKTGEFIEYIINLELTEKPDEYWEISKRYSDFVTIREQLKESLKVLPPKLPKKLVMVTEEEQLAGRRQDLENWLRIVLNEKIYFIPQLFQFVGLNLSYYETLKDEETYSFSNFRAKIEKSEIWINNNKPYTIYYILVEQKSQSDPKNKKRVYNLYRRFKEFDELHQALEKRFLDPAKKLPELPPKYNAFSNKTTVDFRQQGLESYLNQLFAYPNIGDSFAFRKFINFKRPVDSFITAKEADRQIGNSSIDREPEEISNIAIEKTLSTAKSHSKKMFDLYD